MAKIQQTIEMLRGGWNQSGPADVYVEYEAVSTALDTSAFDGTVTYYFDVSVKSTVGVTTVELYNHTDNTPVAGSQIVASNTTSPLPEHLRSGAFTLTGNKRYTVRFKNTVETVKVNMYAARLIVKQKGNITKTQIHQELGYEDFISATTPAGSQPNTMRFLYEAAKYDGSVTIRHEVVTYVNAGCTTYSSIWDVTANTEVPNSTASQYSATDTIAYLQSAPITLIDGHVYQPTGYTSTSAAVLYESNKLVFTITNFTKFLAYVAISTADISVTNNELYAAGYNTYIGTSDMEGCHVTYYFEALLRCSTANVGANCILTKTFIETGLAHAFFTIGVNAWGTVIPERFRSPKCLIDPGEYTYDIGIQTTNNGTTVTCPNAYLIMEVTNIGRSDDFMPLLAR